MASLNAKVLTRVEEVFFGAVGAAKAACTDMGSCRTFTYNTSVTENTATDASKNDAVVKVKFSEQQGNATFVFEDITKENLAMSLGGVVSGSSVVFSPTGTPTYRCAYVTGAELDGAASQVKLHKFYIKPGTTRNFNKEQQLLEVEATLCIDDNGDMVTEEPVSADTTPPTFTCVPADAATGVAVGASVVVTASEAIRSGDVNASNFFIIKSDGTAVAATISFDGTTGVTIDPDSNLSAATPYIAVVNAGVRDLAGNKGARAVFNFTTS
jgi:hypothetical protein